MSFRSRLWGATVALAIGAAIVDCSGADGTTLFDSVDEDGGSDATAGSDVASGDANDDASNDHTIAESGADADPDAITDAPADAPFDAMGDDASDAADGASPEAAADAGEDASDAGNVDAADGAADASDAATDGSMDAADAGSTDAASGGADASDGSADASDAGPPCESLAIPSGGGAVITGSGAALSTTGDACYEAWVNLSTDKASPVILAICNTSSDCNGILEVDGAHHLVFAVENTVSNITQAVSSLDPRDGTWHHVAGCRAISGSNVTLTLYWDGAAIATASGTTASIGAPVDVRLGSLAYATTDGMGGDIDEVRISNALRYTGAFTPAKRFASDASTVVLLHFDAPTATSFDDSSSNAFTGTMLGTTAGAAVCVP